MTIAGLQKLTLLDYPGYVSCVVFTGGCNFKCSFCQNSTLIKYQQNVETFLEDEVIKYLEKRKNILDGVVISGGEPTIQKGLKEFIIKIKLMGFKVKLDTNGYNPLLLKKLIDNELIDYVAMDVKNTLEKYKTIVGLEEIDLKKIIDSINLLKSSKIDHEFRTTIIKEYHCEEDIIGIIDLIGNDEKYYLQNFAVSENVPDKSLHGFSGEELEKLQNLLGVKNQKIKVRGL